MYGEGKELKPVPTPEDKKPNLSSVYALSKYDQERLCLMTGKAYNINTTSLRFLMLMEQDRHCLTHTPGF